MSYLNGLLRQGATVDNILPYFVIPGVLDCGTYEGTAFTGYNRGLVRYPTAGATHAVLAAIPELYLDLRSAAFGLPPDMPSTTLHLGIQKLVGGTTPVLCCALQPLQSNFVVVEPLDAIHEYSVITADLGNVGDTYPILWFAKILNCSRVLGEWDFSSSTIIVN